MPKDPSSNMSTLLLSEDTPTEQVIEAKSVQGIISCVSSPQKNQEPNVCIVREINNSKCEELTIKNESQTPIVKKNLNAFCDLLGEISDEEGDVMLSPLKLPKQDLEETGFLDKEETTIISMSQPVHKSTLPFPGPTLKLASAKGRMSPLYNTQPNIGLDFHAQSLRFIDDVTVPALALTSPDRSVPSNDLNATHCVQQMEDFNKLNPVTTGDCPGFPTRMDCSIVKDPIDLDTSLNQLGNVQLPQVPSLSGILEPSRERSKEEESMYHSLEAKPKEAFVETNLSSSPQSAIDHSLLSESMNINIAQYIEPTSIERSMNQESVTALHLETLRYNSIYSIYVHDITIYVYTVHSYMHQYLPMLYIHYIYVCIYTVRGSMQVYIIVLQGSICYNIYRVNFAILFATNIFHSYEYIGL